MTHKDMIKKYRAMEKAINRSLKSAHKMMKGQKIRSVRYDKNITNKSFTALIERYLKIFPRGTIHEKYIKTMVVSKDGDVTSEIIMQLILSRLDILEGFSMSTSARGGSEAVMEAIDWWQNLLSMALSSMGPKEVVRRLSDAFGVGVGGLADEIEELVLAIYPKLLGGRTKRYDYSRYGSGSSVPELLYDRVRQSFGLVGLKVYPWR